MRSLSTCHLRDAEDTARSRTAQTAVAIERYRLAHSNRPPPSLQALVPSLLEAVPADPYDGRPLHYKQLATGYSVYSIEPDRIDNGGLTEGSDILCTVKR